MDNIIIEAILKKEDNTILALININNEFKELNFTSQNEISSITSFINSESNLINNNNVFDEKEQYEIYYERVINKLERNEILKTEFRKLCNYIKENGKHFGFTYTYENLEFIDWGQDKEGKYPKTIIFPDNIRLDEYEDESLTHNKTNKDIFHIVDKYLEIIDNELTRGIE